MKRCSVVDQKNCVACGSCVKVCPRGAITIYKGSYAVIDETKCVGCGLCTKICPANALIIKEKENEA